MLGAKLALFELGLSIPGDILLAGNALLAMTESEILKDLPVVVQPVDDVAQMAADLLLNMIRAKDSDQLRRVYSVVAIDARPRINEPLASPKMSAETK